MFHYSLTSMQGEKNAFQKKTQKTPKKEIEKAMQIMKEYFEYKQKGHNK
jgi:hypothetical protein